MKSEQINSEDIAQIKNDLAMIKEILIPKSDEEGELSDFAKEELTKARAEPKEEYASLDDL